MAKGSPLSKIVSAGFDSPHVYDNASYKGFSANLTVNSLHLTISGLLLSQGKSARRRLQSTEGSRGL